MKVTKYNTSFDVVETSNQVFWKTHYHNWENNTFDFLFKYLSKDKIFIDIGAWIGPISLIASQYSKQCICFEPDEIAYNEFSENIKLNNINNIILENKAISPYKQIKLGATELGTSITREDCDDNSKIYDCMNLVELFRKYNLSEDNISVLKIDIEGHESELLQDKFLWGLNIPMHISLHPAWKTDKEKFYQDIAPFFDYKGIKVFNRKYVDFFDIEINI
jgi:FkbM family methyltransferase